MKVLIYGGTGSQMRSLALQLLAKGHEPHVLTRSDDRASAQPAGVQRVRGDLADPQSLAQASTRMHAVAFMLPAFLAHPAQALEYASSAAAAAASAGVKLIVWNTSGRYPLPGESRSSDRHMLEAHMRLAAAGVPLTVVAPTTYMENLLGPWTVDAVRAGRVAYPVRPERKMGWIASQDLCALVAAALERPHLAGQVFRVSGIDAVTGPELASAFSQVLQRQLSYQMLTPQEMKQALEAAFGAGAGDSVAEEYALDQADPQPPLKYYDMREVLAVLPVEMTPLRTWIAAHRTSFS